MNCREILQNYGPIYSHLSDKQLFDKISDLAYRLDMVSVMNTGSLVMVVVA